MQQYENHVKPAYDNYIAPTMQHADIIVPRGGENEVLQQCNINNLLDFIELSQTRWRST